METIAYVAPSSVGTIDGQIARLRPMVTEDRYILVDRPNKKGVLSRDRRDFCFGHMLRSAVDNLDGRPDRLIVVSIDVLGDNRREVSELFSTLIRLGVPLTALDDGLDGDPTGTEYVVRWIRAMDRAEGRWERLKKEMRPKRRIRKGTETGGRPRALTPAEVKELVRLKEVEGLNWPKIKEHFASLGRKVGISTLSAHYGRAKEL